MTHDAALRATWYLDADHPDVRAFVRTATADASTPTGIASALFLTVRDHIRHDPYALDLRPAAMRASAVLADERNWCVPKSTLLAAACRAAGVPAHVGLADVRNHLSTPTAPRADGHRRVRLPRLHRDLHRRPMAQGHAGLQPRSATGSASPRWPSTAPATAPAPL